MKKFLRILSIIIVLSAVFLGVDSGKVYADEDNKIFIDMDLNNGSRGDVKAGDTVTIKFKFNKVKDLYAASVDYTYDNTILQVDSIDVDEKIESSGVYEPYRDTAKEGNRARFCFTFLGDGNGLSGDYNFVTINGKAKKDGKILVGPKNISFQLIQRKGDDMVKNDYEFNDNEGDIYKVTNVKEDGDGNQGESASNKSGKKDSRVKVELVKKASDNSTLDNDGSNDDSSDKEDENSENSLEKQNEEEGYDDSNLKNHQDKNEEDKGEEDEDKEEDSKVLNQKNYKSIIKVMAVIGVIILIIIVICLKNKIKNTK